ncbi:uncharacterized protein si:dkey-196h17.9 [Fundulus heteroclitus]|uniref:uncharacterized protein si:dkey-196h17.9 n=1 Tax=Fundulus heteroclitus TaxID=8078 RepID=UPI00165AAA7D|nr:uncharacterized protein si:dkey-196h17.9 [Fundulus heteroclitus]
MKNILKNIGGKVSRMDSTKPLMADNNNDSEDGREGERSTMYYRFNSGRGQRSQELVSMCSDDDVHGSSRSSESNSAQGHDDQYTERSEPLSFPDPPADLDLHLAQHLDTAADIVESELRRLSHRRSGDDRSCLTDDLLCQTCAHLQVLLQNISTSKNCFLLMNWVSQRKTLLDKSELGELDEWETKAQAKLLEKVQEEVRDTLQKILDADRSQTGHDHEAYVRLYLDIIQCINAKPKLAHEISSTLYYQARVVCFEELLHFVKRYTSEQDEILRKKAQTWRENPEILQFLKTLRTCKELRKHVQTEGTAIKRSLLKEIEELLKTMEALTLKLLNQIVTELAETCLTNYFNSPNRLCKPVDRQCDLLATLKNHFPKLEDASEEQRIVMDEAYKVVAHTYLKHLIQKSQRNLRKHWSPKVGQAVLADAENLHTTISDLAPGVKQWNGMLLMIQELLDCKSMDTLKLTVAGIQKDFEEQREDLELLPGLLRWKGLSKRDVREVLEALPDSPPMPSSRPVRSCFCCCS